MRHIIYNFKKASNEIGDILKVLIPLCFIFPIAYDSSFFWYFGISISKINMSMWDYFQDAISILPIFILILLGEIFLIFLLKENGINKINNSDKKNNMLAACILSPIIFHLLRYFGGELIPVFSDFYLFFFISYTILRIPKFIREKNDIKEENLYPLVTSIIIISLYIFSCFFPAGNTDNIPLILTIAFLLAIISKNISYFSYKYIYGAGYFVMLIPIYAYINSSFVPLIMLAAYTMIFPNKKLRTKPYILGMLIPLILGFLLSGFIDAEKAYNSTKIKDLIFLQEGIEEGIILKQLDRGTYILDKQKELKFYSSQEIKYITMGKRTIKFLKKGKNFIQ